MRCHPHALAKHARKVKFAKPPLPPPAPVASAVDRDVPQFAFCCAAIPLAIARRTPATGRDVLTTNGWGMGYGALWMGLFSLIQGYSFAPEYNTSYLGSLFYLAVFGSVIGFGAYFSLIGRIGASQAAYTTLLFPLVALSISTLFEDYQWRPNALIGLLLILAGNAAMFYRPRRPVAPPATAK